MSDLLLNETAEPGVPASAKGKVFMDSADRRVKMKDSKGVVSILGAHENMNYVRNGGFWFAQRQPPATVTTYSNTTGRAISADGWGITNENASVTFNRVDTASAAESGLQSQFYGTFLKTTATGKLILSQVIEGRDTTALRGRTVRVQCWAKAASGTPIFNIALAQLSSAGTIDTMPATFISAFGANTVDPTLGTNLAYITPKSGITPDNAAVDGNHIELTASTTWQRFGGVFDVPSGAKNLVVMIYGDSQFAAAAGINVSQVSLSDGQEIQDWEPLPISTETRRVQRFYSKTFNIDTGPVQNAGVNTGEFRHPSPKGGGAVACVSGTYFHPVPLRVAAVTSTAYNPAAANAQVRNITTGPADCTVQAFAGQTERGCYITYTCTAATVAGDSMGLHMTFDAEL